MSKPKLGYVMRKVTLNSKTVSEFYSDPPKRRQIREGKVNGFVTLFNQGVHFKAPFVANLINSVNRLVDGNHRQLAIERKIDSDPSFEIDVWVAQYKDLTPDEEKTTFNDWNSGTKQSTDDWLKIWWDNVEQGKYFLNKIPCAIYGSPTKIKTRVIMGAHISAVKPGAFRGGYNADGATVVTHAMKIGKPDINMMSAFMTDMGEVFNPFFNKEIFWKTTAVQAFYKIWYDNLQNVPRAKFIKAMKSVFTGPGRDGYGKLCKSSGTAACRAFYDVACNALNLKGLKVIVPTDEDA